jgi:hypothetical protein
LALLPLEGFRWLKWFGAESSVKTWFFAPEGATLATLPPNVEPTLLAGYGRICQRSIYCHATNATKRGTAFSGRPDVRPAQDGRLTKMVHWPFNS